jgi:GT2 family glycosyltransferase
VDLTIVICTHNRVALLERTVRYLNQALRPAECRVTLRVIANACSDDTHAFLERYPRAAAGRDWLPLAWEAEPRPGKSHALNRILPKLTSDLVAFVDDDHRVDEDYLRAVCRGARAHPEASLLCGRIIPDWDGTEPPWVHDTGPHRIYPLPVPRFDLGEVPMEVREGVATPGGGNLAARTAVFARVGLFNPELGPVGHNLRGGEDYHWVRHARRQGEEVFYLPDMIQYHYVDGARLTLPYMMRKAFARTASNARLLGSEGTHRTLPPYMLRKAAEYGLRSLLTLRPSVRRFYLVRFAAALGEVRGFLEGKRAARNNQRAEP